MTTVRSIVYSITVNIRTRVGWVGSYFVSNVESWVALYTGT